jgi:hypothetical protein
MPSKPRLNISDHSHHPRLTDLERYILISLIPFICMILCFLFILLCCKQRHPNRVVTQQYPTIQRNDYDINSSQPPPYNWRVESPPPPPYSSK